jgi:hypothetical protein
MKVLVACEFSGVVRDAFLAKGHDAWSCDIIPTEAHPHRHLTGNVLNYLHDDNWDLLIAFPPCTYLCFAGIRWNTNNPEREEKTVQAVRFFKRLYYSGIPKIAIENPVGVIPKRTGIKWTQMIHPWQFGHEEEKKTCIWLKGLPPLVPTQIMEVREQKIFRRSALRGPGSSKTRSQDRSRTFQGIAAAMADQWV